MTVHMTELIDMFMLHLMFLQYYASAQLKQDMTFLLCYAIADLKLEREESSRRGREAASNAA